MDNVNKKELVCCEKYNASKGFFLGLFYGFIPHLGCLMFIIFTVLGVTTLSAVFRPLLLKSYFFYLLIVLSFALATFSAAIYLKRNSFLTNRWRESEAKWKYLLMLYGTTAFINFFLFFVVFPYAANLNITTFAGSANIIGSQDIFSKITIQVDVPCSGHAPLVIDELKKINGVRDVKFRLPNIFDVSYDSQRTSEDEIISADVFRDFPAKIITS